MQDTCDPGISVNIDGKCSNDCQDYFFLSDDDLCVQEECTNYQYLATTGHCQQATCLFGMVVSIGGQTCEPLTCREFQIKSDDGTECIQGICDEYFYLKEDGQCYQETCEEGCELQEDGKTCFVICGDYFYPNVAGTECL